MAYAKITLLVNSDWGEPLDHVLQILEHTDQGGDLTVLEYDTEELALVPAGQAHPIKADELTHSVSVLEKFLSDMDKEHSPEADTLAAISNAAGEIVDQAESSIHQIIKEERS
tara:strand:+ start:2755 stop:3093 length:339 start_codon:yes stop_codon:yes gene_type:complete